MSVQDFAIELVKGTWGLLVFGFICLVLAYRLGKRKGNYRLNKK